MEQSLGAFPKIEEPHLQLQIPSAHPFRGARSEQFANTDWPVTHSHAAVTAVLEGSRDLIQWNLKKKKLAFTLHPALEGWRSPAAGPDLGGLPCGRDPRPALDRSSVGPSLEPSTVGGEVGSSRPFLQRPSICAPSSYHLVVCL